MVIKVINKKLLKSYKSSFKNEKNKFLKKFIFKNEKPF